jgi:prevent-host-death family protein
MERFIGVEEARACLGRLVEEVAEGAEPIILARRGRARAVLVNLDDYGFLKDEKFREARDELEGLLTGVRKRIGAAGVDRSVVDEAIAAVRKLR